MEIIFEKQNLAELLLGEQKIADIPYRKNKMVMFKRIEDRTVAYNNMTKKLVVLSDEEVFALDELPKCSSVLYNLIKLWFLVPEDFNEEQECDRIYEINELYQDKSYYCTFIILPTTECNARCFYCFEHGVKKTIMSEQTAKDVAEYMIEKSKGQKIKIKWFGGEPLCNISAINTICTMLRNGNVEFSSSMVSNGYLFDKELVTLAKRDWKLHHVQITLDGTEHVYNKIKSYKYRDVSSPFLRVTNNIEYLLNAGINVAIRLNVSDQNRDDIYSLIDYIVKRYPDKKNLRVYSSNLFDLNHNRSPEEATRQNRLNFQLDDYLIEKGLNTYSLDHWARIKRGCMAQNPNAIVISPEGLLGKCEHYSEGKFMHGSIYNNEIDEKSLHYWMEHERLSACDGCIAYIDCYGQGHCPDMSRQCAIVEKPMKYRHVELSIANTYAEWKKKQREKDIKQ